MSRVKGLVLAGAACMFAAGSVCAGELEFTYNPDGLDYHVYGFNKKETYDVAIRISDPMLVGSRVVGMSVPIPSETEWVEDLSAWMSTELKLENKKNVPDITSKAGVLDDYVFSVDFDEPYTITEDGVYVGYSFNVKELGKYSTAPIAVIYGDDPDGLYVHTSRTRLKWASMAEKDGIVSAMTVRIETDFGPADVAVSLDDVYYVAKNEESKVLITLVNHGDADLTGFSYSYNAGDQTGSGNVQLSSPLPPDGRKATAEITVSPIAETGTYPFAVTIDTFNGEVNSDPYKTAAAKIDVLPFVPVNRPLVEEFTGLNCGYCPRGFVAMEQMNHDYPDLFVGMAYHGGDYESGCMVTIKPSQWPVYVDGFPSGTINRTDVMDPSYFTSEWGKYRGNIPMADVEVALEWVDEARTQLRATAVSRFVHDYDNAGYKLSFALVADGLHNEAWKQMNYFAGGKPDSNPDSPYWEPFINGAKKVEGLVFNDVVAYYKDVHGIDGSIPSEIKAGEEYSYEYLIEMSDVKNERGEDFINDGATLHMVAVVLDENNNVVNCNKSVSIPYENLVGVEAITSGAVVVETVLYDFSGRKVSVPGEGVYIKVDRLSDGSVRREKIYKK